MPEKLTLLRPVSSRYAILQRFGENPDRYPLTRGHNGLDFDTPLGTRVHACLPGEVVFAGHASGYGNHIRIRHGDLLHLYAHMLEGDFSVHKAGESVRAGDLIGCSGDTGWSWPRPRIPHLHFEVRRNNRPFDPLPYLVDLPSEAGETSQTGNAALFQARINENAAPYLHMRAAPGIGAPICGRLYPGEVVAVQAVEAEEVWCQAAGGWFAMRHAGVEYANILPPGGKPDDHSE